MEENHQRHDDGYDQGKTEEYMKQAGEAFQYIGHVAFKLVVAAFGCCWSILIEPIAFFGHGTVLLIKTACLSWDNAGCFILHYLFGAGQEIEHFGSGAAKPAHWRHAYFNFRFHVAFRAEITAADIGYLGFLGLKESFQNGNSFIRATVVTAGEYVDGGISQFRISMDAHVAFGQKSQSRQPLRFKFVVRKVQKGHVCLTDGGKHCLLDELEIVKILIAATIHVNRKMFANNFHHISPLCFGIFEVEAYTFPQKRLKFRTFPMKSVILQRDLQYYAIYYMLYTVFHYNALGHECKE
jgi:hypothetical protein